MIEPWQVWLVDIDNSDEPEERLALVVSSEVHLRSQQGRNVLVAPISHHDRKLRNRIDISREGAPSFVMTEQVRFISTNRFTTSEPSWTLTDDEITHVKRMLKLMVAF